MTSREQIRAEADEAARAFAARLASEEQVVTGIPKPPEITVTETTTDVEPFGLDLDPKSSAEIPATTGPGPPGPPSCNPCDQRHLSIRFRCAGNIQSDGCFPNAGLASWDCGLFGFPPAFEVDILPCSSTFSHNFTLDYGDSICTDWEACDTGGDPATCGWHAGVKLSLIGGHTLRSSYDTNTYSAFTSVTRNCDGNPTICDARYDSASDGLPPLPTDIVVPDWCAAVGTQLFGYNGFWSVNFAKSCQCFGGSGSVILGYGLYFYIDVT